MRHLKLYLTALLLLSSICVASPAQSRKHRPKAGPAGPALSILNSTRERDGLKGPVRRVKAEVAGVRLWDDFAVESTRSLLEVTVYDAGGRRIENETYPVNAERAGQERHRYDEQGQLVETVVSDGEGAVLSRIVYDYEYDEFGNWTTMTAAFAVTRAGEVKLEPFEVTHRAITYYLRGEAGPVETAARRKPAADAARRAEVARAPAAAGETVAVGDAQPPAAGVAGEDESIDVGALNDKTADLPKPAYPVGPRAAARPVKVTVEVVIDQTGRVVSAKARGGTRLLQKLAEEAASRAAFLPFTVEGRPVRAKGFIEYGFRFQM